jgi:RNA polymerase-interacting CarD/CdnL/TRCF family regulator
MPLVTDIKDVAFEEGFYKNAIERISVYTLNGEKPDAVVMMWVENIVAMIRFIKDQNHIEYQEFKDDFLKNRIKAMESMINHPLIAKDLQISDETLTQIPLHIDEFKRQLTNKQNKEEASESIDKSILDSPLYFLQSYLLNMKRISQAEVDKFILHIYIYTKYKYEQDS